MTARAQRLSVGLLCLAATVAGTSGVAFATAPVLESVTVCNQVATYRWSLPPGVESRLVQTATASTTDPNGYFYPQANLYTFNIPGKADTSLVDDEPFAEGTYYVHVAGNDAAHPPPPAPEFSKTVKFVVDAKGNGTGVDQPGTSPACRSAGGGGAGGGGGGGGPGIVNKVAPFGRLSYRRIQSIGKLFVTAKSTDGGTLRAVGSITVPGAAKVYRFNPVSRKVGAFGSVKLRLRLSKKNLLAVRRALKKKGARLKARITVTATNSAGAARSQKATIKLKL